MKLFLAPNKNETPRCETMDLVADFGDGRRTVYAAIMFDLFFDSHRSIYNKLRSGKEVEITITEVE
jgi:hypothetical protein